MITLYEGIVLNSTPGSEASDPKTNTISVFLEEPQIIVDAVLNRTHWTQQVPPKDSKVLVYRTYNDQARVIATLDDLPASSPIWKFNTPDTSYFLPGEVAIQAVGNSSAIPPHDGGLVWCQNSGDVSIFSGSLMQSVFVGDSIPAVVLEGSNISLATNTSKVATHAFTLSTNLVGLSSSQWGVQNPVSGLFGGSVHIDSLGNINLGLSAPLLGTLLSGISCVTTPTLTQPAGGITLLTPGVISMTAPLGISMLGKTSITGLLSILGNTSATGLFSVVGNTSITGILNVVGNYNSNGIPGITGVFPVHPGGTIAVVGGIVVAVT